MKRGLLFLFIVSLLTGCVHSRGFDRGELRDVMSEHVVVNDQKIADALALKAQLPKPFKLGVYFKDPLAKHRWETPKWRWTDEDKQKILTIAEKLKDSGEIKDVFVISEATVGGQDLSSLRFAAAQHGADALLVVSGVDDLDAYNNSWSWTYIAIAPALFVPGSELDALFLARAVMWDVRNEFLYLTADAESVKHQTRPAAFKDEREALDAAKVETMDHLHEQLSRRLSGLQADRAAN